MKFSFLLIRFLMIHEIKLLNMEICKYLPKKIIRNTKDDEILKHSTINVGNHFYYIFFLLKIIKNDHYYDD